MLLEFVNETQLARVIFMDEGELIAFTNSQLSLQSGQDLLDFEPPSDSAILAAWAERFQRANQQLILARYSLNTDPNLIVIPIGDYDLIVPL